MKKKIISVGIVILFILSIFSSYSVVSITVEDKNSSDDENISMNTKGKIIKKYGQEYLKIEGDVKHYDASHLEHGSKFALRMGQGIIPIDGYAYYDFEITDYPIAHNSIEIGVESCDWAEVPLTLGATPLIYNWKYERYDESHELGDQNDLEWKWMGYDADTYVRQSDGKILICIRSDGYDDSGCSYIRVFVQSSIQGFPAISSINSALSVSAQK